MDRWQAMQRFVRVAELGSFTRAAEQLQLPKASISATITALEARLGTRLFHRSTRRITLTQDGTEYFHQCRELLATLDELESQFQRAPAEVAGRVRVDMPVRTARQLVIPRLPEFFALYPNLHVELGSADQRVNLVEDAYDCVVRVGALTDSSLVARPVGDVISVNCAAPAYLARHGEPCSLADLEHHLLVHYAPRLGARCDGFEYLDEHGIARQIEMRGSVTVNGTESYLAACLAGLGIAQIPWIGVRELVQAGELRVILPQYQAQPMPMNLLYPSRRHPPKRVVLFMEWLTDILREALAEPAPAEVY